MRLFSFFLLCASAWSLDYEVRTIRAPRSFDYRIARDVDGDGLNDLVIVTGNEVWLWRGKRAGPGAEPDLKRALPKGAALFDFESANGPLIVRTHDAYWSVPWKGEPVKHAMPSGPGLPRRPGNVLWRGFFRDIDQDKKQDFVDVSMQGYRIRFGAGDDIVLPPHIHESATTGQRAVSGRNIARFALGDWTSGNFNGDLRPDFGVATNEGLLVYPGDAKGRFDPKRTLLISLPNVKESDLVYVDVNRDGQTDIMAVDRKKGHAVMLTGDPKQGLLKPYRTEKKVSGYMRPPVLADFNGDLLPDLALPYVPTPSFADAVRVIARAELLVKVPVFLNRGGPRPFAGGADTVLSMPVRIRMGTDEAGRFKISGLIVVEYGGDLDGDGRKDLIVTEKTSQLAVYRGVNKTVFREEAWMRIAIPDCAAYESVKSAAADLNGDGRSDIILHYLGGGRRPDQVHLLLSRKK
jgi:hypothetical protein